MSILYVTIGLPASGKSTYYKKNFSLEQVTYISSDAIRKELYGTEKCQDNPSKVFSLMRERTIAALKDGKDVYYDATNVSRKRRIEFLNNKEFKNVKKVALFFAVPFNTCCNYNSLRERVVPKEVIERMYKHFNVPQLKEGFDSISIIRDYNIPVPYHLANNIINTLKLMPHDNPHHTLTIGEHMLQAEKYAIQEDYCLTVREAAKFHDIGKPFVKSFINNKGEKTSQAKYYSHEFISAYIYMTFCNKPYSIKEEFEIAELIENHMIFYHKNWDKELEKKDFDFTEKLIQLNNCDKNAH